MKITKRQLRKIIKEAMPKGGVPDIVGAITGVYGEKNRRERSRAGETAWPPRAPARQHYWKDSKTGKQYWVTKEELKALEKGLPCNSQQVPSLGCNIKWTPGKEPDWFN